MTMRRSRVLSYVIRSTLAAALPGAALAQSASGGAAAQSLNNETLDDEIVVTASRRDQLVTEVPYNISAYSGDALERANVVDIASLARFAPGIVVFDTGAANRTNRNPITIRGVNMNSAEIPARSDLAVPTVSQYIGEVPVQFPLKFFDVERIEVLRGPQGTLYGSGSLAGTIRVIPRGPDVSGFAANVTVSAGNVAHSDGYDRKIEGAVNVPFADGRAAFRLAAGYQYDAGFIGNRGLVVLDSKGVPVPRVANDLASGFVVAPAADDVNDANYRYARAAVRFQLSDAVDVTATYHFQKIAAGAPSEVNPNFPGMVYDSSFRNFPGALYPNNRGFPNGRYPNGSTTFPAGGEYDQYRLVPLPAERRVHIGNVAATVDLGFASLSSSTSFTDVDSAGVRDGTMGFAIVRRPGARPLAALYGYYPRLIVNQTNTNRDKFFTQELRLVSAETGALNYVVGAYYQHQKSNQLLTERAPGVAAFLGIPAGTPGATEVTYTDGRDFKFTDLALFGEVTWQVTSDWQITGGARAFRQSFATDATQTFPVCGRDCANDGVNPAGLVEVLGSKKSFKDSIFKLNTSYSLTSDLLVYGTVSQGFRRGGTSGVPLAGNYASLPKYLSFDPDTTTNSEVGIKGRIGSATFSAAVFNIDWKDFQYEVGSPSAGAQLVVNGTKARTRGIELEVQSLPTLGFGYSLGYTYADAKVTKDFTAQDLPLGALTFAPSAPVNFSELKSGDRLPGVPKSTVTAALSYGWQVGADFVLRAQVDGSYRGDSFTTFNASGANVLNYARIDGFTLMNASLALESGRNWSATLYANNVTDELGSTGGTYTTYAFGLLGGHRFVTRPRQLGLAFRYSFDAQR